MPVRRLSGVVQSSCFSEPGKRGQEHDQGFAKLDLSLTKDTKISESTMLELEIFNFVSHTNLGFPMYDLFANATRGRNTIAGQIQDTVGYTSRQIQLAAKFMF